MHILNFNISYNNNIKFKNLRTYIFYLVDYYNRGIIQLVDFYINLVIDNLSCKQIVHHSYIKYSAHNKVKYIFAFAFFVPDLNYITSEFAQCIPITFLSCSRFSINLRHFLCFSFCI